MQAAEIIIQKIKETGPIPFCDFMEMALYDPVSGYYLSDRTKAGREGDFYTSPCMTRVFGAMIGRQIEEMWAQMGPPFTILEFGAGSGLLCMDILEYLKKNPDCFRDLHYIIVEKNQKLPFIKDFLFPGKISRMTKLEEVGKFQGCVLSNEFFDNFPVHRISMQNQLMETWVDFKEGFHEIFYPASYHTQECLKKSGMVLPRGGETELNPGVSDWFENLSKHFLRGYLLTIDYGYQAAEYPYLKNQNGTLRCYYQHHQHNDPYIHIGRQDITADVNFTALSYWGQQHGYSFSGYTNQAYFLKALGFTPYLDSLDIPEEDKLYAARILTNQMGNRMKVLIQQNKMSGHLLRGLVFRLPMDKTPLSYVEKNPSGQYIPF
jgi:SAM-dependent MidA family methyltransferase